MPIVKPLLTEIKERELLRYAGAKGTEAVDKSLLRAVCREALLYARPAGSWEIYDYQPPALLAGGQFIPGGAAVARHMDGAAKAALLAVTVGEDLEGQVKKLFDRGDYAMALLLDAAATAAVEQTADSVCSFIAGAAAGNGLAAGGRFSPGYADWELAQQPAVLRLAGAGKIGITVSSAFMLLPRKSVTAIVPLFPRQYGRRPEADGCAGCGRTDCPFNSR